MNIIYALVRLFPFWAIPGCFILFQLGNHLRRKGDKLFRMLWGLIAIFIALLVLWFVFRGDLHSDHWVRTVLGD
jgi:uncharacterized membrane protein YfcA